MAASTVAGTGSGGAISTGVRELRRIVCGERGLSGGHEEAAKILDHISHGGCRAGRGIIDLQVGNRAIVVGHL